MNLEKFLKHLEKENGATVKIKHRRGDEIELELLSYDKGYQVSLDEEHGGKEIQLDTNNAAFIDILTDIIGTAEYDQTIGFWLDDHTMFIDYSTVYVKILAYAKSIGRSNKQKAIFDWSTFDSIYL